MPDDHTVLMISLEAAVPLRIAELEAMPDYERQDILWKWRGEASEAVAHRGDILQYGSKRKGQAGLVFNHLAKGLAVLAHAPGGVTFHGVHWCLEHPGGMHTDRPAELD